MWVDNLMSFLKFIFSTTIGSHFWDLLQEVSTRVIQHPRKREPKRALEILRRKKNSPFIKSENNSRKERCWPKPHNSRMAGRSFDPDILASQSRAYLLYFLRTAPHCCACVRLGILMPPSVSYISHEKYESQYFTICSLYNSVTQNIKRC